MSDLTSSFVFARSQWRLLHRPGDLAEAMNWVNAGTLAAATVGLLLVPASGLRKAIDTGSR